MRTFQLSLLAATLMLATGLARAAGGEIAVIVKTSSSNYWQNVQKGANAAMGQLKGYTMTFQGPAAETAIADEVNMVENAVNRKVAGIVLAPSDPDALVPAVKKAWEAIFRSSSSTRRSPIPASSITSRSFRPTTRRPANSARRR